MAKLSWQEEIPIKGVKTWSAVAAKRSPSGKNLFYRVTQYGKTKGFRRFRTESDRYLHCPAGEWRELEEAFCACEEHNALFTDEELYRAHKELMASCSSDMDVPSELVKRVAERIRSNNLPNTADGVLKLLLMLTDESLQVSRNMPLSAAIEGPCSVVMAVKARKESFSSAADTKPPVREILHELNAALCLLIQAQRSGKFKHLLRVKGTSNE